MTDDPRVQELLDELLSSHATPEEVCASWPDLLPTVRNRWRQIRRLRSDLDALFPPADQPGRQATEGQGLPQIPGYEVEAVLGRGGKGIVFRARHLRLKRVVALKMLLDGAYATPQDRARFQREAEAVAGVRHPHIVQVYDVGEHESQLYFTMELVEGGSLAEKLTGTPQPRCQAAALIATLATAVHAAHQSGIVHRDLKPGNVLLTADGTPKISDFGLARRLESRAGLTQSGAPFGTPSYMAPEQARGKVRAMGPAVDVYALGAILYELLTGRPPFKGETPADTVLQVVSQEVVPPSRMNATVPRDLETICLKCLQKDSERRYSNAAALLLAALSGLLMIGAVRMLRLRSFPLAAMTAILAMVPWSPGWLIGLPFGIWACIVLGRPQVVEGFFSRDDRGVSPTTIARPRPVWAIAGQFLSLLRSMGGYMGQTMHKRQDREDDQLGGPSSIKT
jgi:serine/threonine-protein kinase